MQCVLEKGKTGERKGGKVERKYIEHIAYTRERENRGKERRERRKEIY